MIAQAGSALLYRVAYYPKRKWVLVADAMFYNELSNSALTSTDPVTGKLMLLNCPVVLVPDAALTWEIKEESSL